jgi:hypothetical protein
MLLTEKPNCTKMQEWQRKKVYCIEPRIIRVGACPTITTTTTNSPSLFTRKLSGNFQTG